MATLIIPFDTTQDHFTFTAELDSANYGFEFKFNARDERWYFDFFDASNNLLLGSIPAMIGWPCFKQFSWNPAFPPGILYFMDQSGQDLEPGRFELGNDAAGNQNRVQLIYEEAASA